MDTEVLVRDEKRVAGEAEVLMAHHCFAKEILRLRPLISRCVYDSNYDCGNGSRYVKVWGIASLI